ncbi:MAG: response regulator [Desulfobacteraceae bacterium]|nr:response regulator [Desulfobacteraceae bacterium]MBC2755950.1 response regulator [Desulfobacteraceae bacterium]
MTEPIKILIVDDEEDFCFFVHKNLTNTGKFEVYVATNGKYGLELAQTKKPDMILLDLIMPDMSGDEVAQALKNNSETENIPITFLTALVTREDSSDGVMKKIGEKYFIAKPVRTLELVGAIVERLEGC